MMIHRWMLIGCVMTGSLLIGPVRGDEPAMPTVIDAPAEAEPAPAPDAQREPAAATDETAPPSAEDVMRDLLRQRQENPLIEPTTRPAIEPQPTRVGAPAAAVDVDPAILGIAPGATPPPLKREGAFIISRRGRLVRSADGAHVLFAFEADDKDSPEAPMIMLPCQMLQNMEDLVQQRGDRTVFIISGQVTTYRNANYLLPTMMKLAIDQGNLRN